MTQLRVWTLFSALFAVFYLIAVEMNWALVTYHPRLGEFGLWTQAARKGPAMHWYGWLLSAGIGAGVVTACATPVLGRITLPSWVGWAVPLACIVAFLWFLRIFFLR